MTVRRVRGSGDGPYLAESTLSYSAMEVEVKQVDLAVKVDRL